MFYIEIYRENDYIILGLNKAITSVSIWHFWDLNFLSYFYKKHVKIHNMHDESRTFCWFDMKPPTMVDDTTPALL